MRLLLPLPVLLPLIGAGLALVLARHPRWQRLVSVGVLTGVLSAAVALLVIVDSGGAQAVTLGGWPAPLGITLVADRLSALMLLVSAVVLIAVLFYAIGQGMAGGDDETPVSIFHPTYLVLTAGVANAFLAGDLFNLFVGFEILLVASYVLLTLGGTGPRVRAGMTYVVVSLLSSMLFLTGIALVYAATGTLNLADLSGKLALLPPGTALALQLVLLTAFGIKAAVFPLSAWLPDSYPTAPAPVTAVFAGLLTKVGVYAIIRTQTLLFPESPLTGGLLVVALATMVVGILGAIAQSDIKRMLSFTLVSHIGYMVFGIALATEAGLAGAVFYVAHHITIQTTLFLVVGLVERRGGTTSLHELGGLAWLSPLVAVLFFVPAMNLAGIPPFSGFIGKVGLMQAGVEDGGPLALTLVVASAATGLLTLYAMAKAWNLAFWQNPPEHALTPAMAAEVSAEQVAGTPAAAGETDTAGVVEATTLPRSMVASTTALVLFGLALTVFGGPLYAIADRAAVDTMTSDSYVQAVFGEQP